MSPMWFQMRISISKAKKRRRKQIQWTLEWISQDGTSTLDKCLEYTPLLKAYQACFHKNSPTPPVEPESLEPLCKRQKQEVDGNSKLENEFARNNGTPLDSMGTVEESSPDASLTLPAQEEGLRKEENIENDAKRKTLSSEVGPSHKRLSPVLSNAQSVSAQSMPLPQPGALSRTEPSPSAAQTDVSVTSTRHLNYYLHAPRLPSPQPVLIPLSPEAKLFESLHGRLRRVR